jgi:UDP-N-acetylmuramate--alanine ligase
MNAPAAGLPERPALPPPPACLFLVGIGGIGMSGLAQLLRWLGYEVGGSDREVGGSGRDDLYERLAAQGIRLWPQDGSGVQAMAPAALVYSTAVEADNPDFAAAGPLPRLHRAAALAAALARTDAPQIGVAGSCGKTTVTAWLASALRACGQPVLTVCGGYVREFEGEARPGNFHADPNPAWQVVEVDESDGSLLSFSPDLGLILNIGTDHFERPRLVELFTDYAARCRLGAIVRDDLAAELAPGARPWAGVFARTGRRSRSVAGAPLCLRPVAYRATRAGAAFALPGWGRVTVPQFGRHAAENAAAVLAALRTLLPAPTPTALLQSLRVFRGVARRFESVGALPGGAQLFDDYAHNVEKIGAALAALQEIRRGPLLACFQPHGFGPLGFMRTALAALLRTRLRPGDRFAFLPVYYAGGTTRFRPTAAEVAAEYAAAGLPVTTFASRDEAATHIQTGAGGAATVLVLGARDPSLSAWCRSLTACPAAAE